MKLNDKLIRKSLMERIFSLPHKPRSIIQELGVEDGMAIADVVAIYKYTHCFEIKSDLDSLVRLDRQIDFYNRSFQKITLVVTEKYRKNIFDVIPDFWGVMEAYQYGGDIKFRYLRKSKFNGSVDTSAVLYGLWKSELESIYLSVFGNSPRKSFNRDRIISDLLDSNKSDIIRMYADVLSTRNHRKSLMIYSK